MNLNGKKNKMKLFLGVLLLAGAVRYVDATDVPSNAEESQRNQAAVLKYVGLALKDCRGVARIDYVTVCAAKDGTPLPFPAIKVQPASKGSSGLAAVREIFSHDKNVSVSQSPVGIIRVTIGQPMGSIILQTKIHSLALDQDEQYNAVPTIYAILGCKEVQAAMHRLGFEQPLTVMHAGIARPEEGEPPLPRLPACITDLTVDQALDLIAKTFSGIVIYEECVDANGKRLFSLDFTHAGGE
jgi:hypothetical protein